MDNKKLKGIVDIFNDSGLTFMEINEKEGENAFSIKLEKKGRNFTRPRVRPMPPRSFRQRSPQPRIPSARSRISINTAT